LIADHQLITIELSALAPATDLTVACGERRPIWMIHRIERGADMPRRRDNRPATDVTRADVRAPFRQLKSDS